ncbi:MAG: hypothetical protein IPF66_00015 [Holophagales bacterium]|nr:hypothetical protein [Holophagales bacterium]
MQGSVLGRFEGDSPATREIVEAARKRLKENPSDVGAVMKLADALAGSGRKTEAVRILNQYGPIVQSRGRLESAIAIYKKATQLDPDSELTSSTYLSHLQLQSILEAEKAVRAAAPPAAPSPPPSGSFTRPGPTSSCEHVIRARPSWRAPPSGSFPIPALRRVRRRAGPFRCPRRLSPEAPRRGPRRRRPSTLRRSESP